MHIYVLIATNLNEDEIEKSAWVCSPEFYRIFGIDETYPHTIEGWANFIHPDFANEIVSYHESVVKGKKIFNREYKIVRINDGEERWVHGTGKLEYDENGNPIRMHGAIQDITDRKQIEAKLFHQKDLMQYVIEHANSAVAVHNRDLRYIYVSDRYLEQFGIKEKNI
ncbi:MAG: PAS domain-containing protein [Melioribacteraceae bacterium]|nr:PAS domain-containing protein [Melioribacteraceae bacterium]